MIGRKPKNATAAPTPEHPAIIASLEKRKTLQAATLAAREAVEREELALSRQLSQPHTEYVPGVGYIDTVSRVPYWSALLAELEAKNAEEQWRRDHGDLVHATRLAAGDADAVAVDRESVIGDITPLIEAAERAARESDIAENQRCITLACARYQEYLAARARLSERYQVWPGEPVRVPTVALPMLNGFEFRAWLAAIAHPPVPPRMPLEDKIEHQRAELEGEIIRIEQRQRALDEREETERLVAEERAEAKQRDHAALEKQRLSAEKEAAADAEREAAKRRELIESAERRARGERVAPSGTPLTAEQAAMKRAGDSSGTPSQIIRGGQTFDPRTESSGRRV